MSPHQAFEWILLLLFFGVICESMVRWTNRPVCPMCGGKQEHSKDCPWKEQA